ncbi:phospholipase D-like domain-containing protein [Halosolutus gelatinilyticus]|uniref:phospholipase D-like domain-containing protein n=1 Tax=Halosolutus gelatinilyticus TaxID=2931975 RepID=UPI001FF3179D|nr:phospholipase D-like domain-containing protein [Halosolutus gelatinilyticus]
MASLSPATDVVPDVETGSPVETAFSYPTLRGEPDDVHEETVATLLSRAAPGSTVHLSTFTFTRTNLARTCIEAAERGVDLNILIDEHFAHTAATRLLLDELDDSVSITVDGAIGDNINHNKFLLLDTLRNGETEVVWQSSANFTNSQRHLHNTSIVFRGDADLYDAYRSYWNDMMTGETNYHYNRTVETDTATVFFSPRSDFDPLLTALENVSPSSDAAIRFMYFIWDTGRLEVIDRIAELVDGGCSVGVILNQGASNVADHLRNAGAEVLEYPSYTPRKGLTPDRSPNVHSKNMLIDADFDVDGDAERRKLVYTGSQNLSGFGLTNNDETLLRIEDDDVYCRFLRDWNRVRSQGLVKSGMRDGVTRYRRAARYQGSTRC